MRGPTGDGPLASAPAVARLQGGLCRGSLTAAPLSAMPCATPLLHHARIAASTLHHVHQACITCIKPASPASNLHHLHQACITCIRPASPASRVHQLHHTCINCITRASRRGIPVVSPLLYPQSTRADRGRGPLCHYCETRIRNAPHSRQAFRRLRNKPSRWLRLQVSAAVPCTAASSVLLNT